MTSWKQEKIEIADGTKVLAQMPVIVSASRSTDIPAFYSDWFMERLEAGYVKWFNPFNGVPLYVGFKKMRCIVFWSKNPRPMLVHLDALDTICLNYYFQFTLNDYDAERIEPNVPSVANRVETFRRLSERIGRDRVIWRFDPLIITDKLAVKDILEKVERLGDKLAAYTSRLVFSFIDIKSYAKVGKNLERVGIAAREFSSDEMCEVAQRIGELVKGWGITAGTCGEIADLDRYGIEHNRCIDDRLMVKCFSRDAELMKFIGPSLSNRKDTLQITWWFLVCQILDTQPSFLRAAYALVVDGVARPFAVKSSRPRRGGAKRQGWTSREGREVFAGMFGLVVCRLYAPYLAQSLDHAPVELHSAETRLVRRQRGFLLRREHVFVQHPLVRGPRLVVCALEALAVRALLLRHEHLARAEEVAEVRPVVAEPDELALQRGAVEPDLPEELPP
jgi:hypothetical protein